MPIRPRARWLLPSLLLLAMPAEAAPPERAPEQSDDARGSDRSAHVIPPGRETAARELLERVTAATTAPLSWRGPSIEFDRIKWWLELDGRPCGMLMLLPRELGEADEPRSRSFAIRAAWAPDHQAQPHELALMQQAIEAVQAGDRGQFYLVRFDLFEDQAQLPPPYTAAPPSDATQVRQRWALELGGVAVLGLLALGVTLRRRPADA